MCGNQRQFLEYCNCSKWKMQFQQKVRYIFQKTNSVESVYWRARQPRCNNRATVTDCYWSDSLQWVFFFAQHTQMLKLEFFCCNKILQHSTNCNLFIKTSKWAGNIFFQVWKHFFFCATTHTIFSFIQCGNSLSIDSFNRAIIRAELFCHVIPM